MRRSRNDLKEPGVKRYSAQPPGYGDRAFTLVELLVVITIIAMLATMTLLVVGYAQRAARIAATEATIARIDTALCEMYETYTNRRIDTGQLPSDLDSSLVARIRLHLLWDTMRMEMPNNWEEAVTPPRPFEDPPGTVWEYTDSSGAKKTVQAEDPPLRRIYMEAFRQAVVDAGGTLPVINPDSSITIDYTSTSPHYTVRKNEEAKLLYQIVMNGNPEAREMFTDRGVAILDDDGLPCFVDSWGRPIYFLRWAPGFAGSDRQPDLWKWTGNKPNKGTGGANEDFWKTYLSPDVLKGDYFEKYYNDSTTRGNLDAITTWEYPPPSHKSHGLGAPFHHKYLFETLLKYPDPLDLAKVRPYRGTDSTQILSRPGFFLIPLVFSAGPDGEYGITTSNGQGLDKLTLDPFQRGWGAPFVKNKEGEELDNIHNHRLGGR
ncbi:MAG: prepilin-type N-terminal cleavage/methylation domain-containing protein [Planctomycetaceae bacterium]|nr:prepilin-type N-terminal cleavage/methylation domain-containing protein [Planctomycetaceae bacterium]